ncbi:MAG TPA: 6-bladed beta-propeller [Chloroflexia bacterium]|nr:6-bladed beta-propeller [Chloroflexia bacterium]
MLKRNILLIISQLLILSLFLYPGSTARTAFAAGGSRYFPETGHTVQGKFLDYWQSHGGLPIFGFPITDAKPEVDPETGKVFLSQWFERNRFELHPEFAGTEYEVLLGLLGKQLRGEAQAADPAFTRTTALYNPGIARDKQWYFPETGHNLRLRFLQYWLENGGLMRFGYPISEEHEEVDPETGNVFLLQWFERARFEYHPENRPPYDILLGLLGNQLKNSGKRLELSWKIGTPGYRLYKAGKIAFDQWDNLYLSDSISNVQIFTPDGRFQGLIGGPGSNNGQFYGATGMEVDATGNLYVADMSNNRVQKFDSQGNFLLKWGQVGAGDGQFSGPSAVVVDKANNVYVTDNYNNRIQKFDSQGRFLAKWGSQGSGDDQFSYPKELAIDAQNNLYLADGENHRIQKFDSQGHFLAKWGNPGSGQGQFNWINGLAVDAQGNIYVADTIIVEAEKKSFGRVQKFDSQGRYLLEWNGRNDPDGWFYTPTGLAVDKQGNFFLVEGSESFSRVKKFDGQGHLLAQWNRTGTGEGQFSNPQGFTLDRAGNIYVADTANQRIQKFDSQGRFLLAWGSPGNGNGQFGDPRDVAADSQGNVYTLENSVRVQKFDSQGHFLSKWNLSRVDAYSVATGIAIDRQDNLFVGYAGFVLKYDSQGHLLQKWALQPYSGPTSLALDGQGNLYVAVLGTEACFVLKYDSNGQLLTQWEEEQKSQVMDIALDSSGNLYEIINSPAFVYIQKKDPNGQIVYKWADRSKNADGEINALHGSLALAVDISGRVYILDSTLNRLTKFRQP